MMWGCKGERRCSMGGRWHRIFHWFTCCLHFEVVVAEMCNDCHGRPIPPRSRRYHLYKCCKCGMEKKVRPELES